MSGGMSNPANRCRHRLGRGSKGPVSQRQLLAILSPLIDAAMGKAASRTRDEARATIRRLLVEANWNTPFVKRNLGTKRCRYLSSIGVIIESRYLAATPDQIARMNGSVSRG